MLTLQVAFGLFSIGAGLGWLCGTFAVAKPGPLGFLGFFFFAGIGLFIAHADHGLFIVGTP